MSSKKGKREVHGSIRARTEELKRRVEEAPRGGLIPSDWLSLIEDHLYISKRRRGEPLPLFMLQLNMLEHLLIHEDAVSKYKQELKSLSKKGGDDSPATEEDQMATAVVERELFIHRALRQALRDVADGIAWRALDYDRAMLHVIADRPGSAHVEGGGLEAELWEFAYAIQAGEGLSILNDLTNFLKLGDVSVVREDGSVEFVEVKAGGTKSGRIARQKKAMETTVTFLGEGEKEHESGKLTILELDVHPKSFVSHVHKIIERATKHGAAGERIGDHLVVTCVDYLSEAKLTEEKVKQVLGETEVLIRSWEEAGDLVFPYCSPEKYSQVRWYAPFSIYPFCDLCRAKLMIGAVNIVAHVNFSAVFRYIESRGWKVVDHVQDVDLEGTPESELRKLAFATASKGQLTSSLTPLEMGRLGYEFLRPKTLVDNLEALLEEGPPPSEHILPSMTHERELWD